jgi:diguanylate cyclase (GGDEF)-like protein
VSLATVDELTGLSNRRGFCRVAEKVLGSCRRNGTRATLLFFDLDHFKEINDRFGHAEGDRALREFAGLLTETFRESDLTARLSGDEFAVLCLDLPEHGPGKPLERLAKRITERNGAVGIPYALEYSGGVAFFRPDKHDSIEDVLDQADREMYRQKQGK